MTQLIIKIRLEEGAKMPVYSSQLASGFDLFSSTNASIPPGGATEIRTGVYMEIPPEYLLFIRGRSSLALNGVHTIAGLIDPDYRGEISPFLENRSPHIYTVSMGDRIAQGIILPRLEATFKPVEELNQTPRGQRGFGSTGR